MVSSEWVKVPSASEGVQSSRLVQLTENWFLFRWQRYVRYEKTVFSLGINVDLLRSNIQVGPVEQHAKPERITRDDVQLGDEPAPVMRMISLLKRAVFNFKEVNPAMVEIQRNAFSTETIERVQSLIVQHVPYIELDQKPRRMRQLIANLLEVRKVLILRSAPAVTTTVPQSSF